VASRLQGGERGEGPKRKGQSRQRENPWLEEIVPGISAEKTNASAKGPRERGTGELRSHKGEGGLSMGRQQIGQKGQGEVTEERPHRLKREKRRNHRQSEEGGPEVAYVHIITKGKSSTPWGCHSAPCRNQTRDWGEDFKVYSRGKGGASCRRRKGENREIA